MTTTTADATQRLLADERGTCFLVPGVLSPGECQEWIATTERLGYAPTGGAYPPAYRDNDRLVFDDPALAATLFARCRAHLPARLLRDGAAWRLAGLNHRFRCCRYRGGQSFSVHRDGPHVAGPGLRSWLTFMLYLVDARELQGGATRFYGSRRAAAPLFAVPPRAGALIVFGHDVWHDGEAVTAGTKYVLRSDVLYAREEGPPAADDEGRCRRLAGHTGYVWQALLASDGALLSAARDGAVMAWDLARPAGAPRRVCAQPGSVTALVEAEPGRLWTGARDGTLRVDAGARPLALPGRGAVLALQALGEGRVAVARGGGPLELRARTGELLRALEGHQGWVWCLARDGARLLSGGEDGTVRAWDLPAGAGQVLAQEQAGAGQVLAQEQAGVRALVALPGGALAWGTGAGELVWRAPSGARTRLPRAHTGAVRALCALPGGRLASGGEDDLVRVWGPERELLRELPHGDFVTSLLALPGGRLASGCYDALVRVWELD